MFHSIHWRFCLVNYILLVGFQYTAAQPEDPTKWWLYPPPNDILYLAQYQVKIQNENLFDVYTENQHDRKWCTDPKIGIFGRAPKYCNRRRNKARRPDGQCNDFDNPAAGSRLYRFGRNIPLTSIDRDECSIYHPNPRMISRKLLQRKEFKPATSLNLHIAGWIQFMTHDWFDHGTNDLRRLIEVKLAPDDPDFTGKTMKIPRSRSDGCSSFPKFFIDACNSLPKKPKWCQGVKSFDTFQNTVTHWWDGSQLYGSDSKTLRKVRSYKNGKLKMDENGRLPIDPETGLPITGNNNNWWAGLEMMHVLWTKEHNHVCDMLKQRNPKWNDEELFQTTRLIITAVIARIHTLEWTTAILNSNVLKIALKSNWYGVSLLEIVGGNATIAALLAQKFPQFANGVPGAVGKKDLIGYTLVPNFIPYPTSISLALAC